MPIPQVPDRLKETPAALLRAVFAGVGQLLLAAEKIRARAMEQVESFRDQSRHQPPERPPATVGNVTPLHEAGDHAERLAAADGTAPAAQAGTSPAAPLKPAPSAARGKPAAGTAPRGKPDAAAGRAPAKRPRGRVQPSPASPAPASPAAASPAPASSAPADQVTAAPPIPNYDELSVASLRARLRVLD